MSNVQLNSGSGGALVACNPVTRDNGAEEQMQLLNIADPNPANGGRAANVTAAGALQVDNSGVTQPISGSVSVSNFPTSTGTGSNGTGTGQFVPTSDNSVSISVNNTTTTLVSGVPNQKIYVTAYSIVANGTGTVQWAYGSGPTALSGAMAVTAETGVSAGSGLGAVLIVPAGQDFKIVTTTQIQGHLAYTQF